MQGDLANSYHFHSIDDTSRILKELSCWSSLTLVKIILLFIQLLSSLGILSYTKDPIKDLVFSDQNPGEIDVPERPYPHLFSTNSR